MLFCLQLQKLYSGNKCHFGKSSINRSLIFNFYYPVKEQNYLQKTSDDFNVGQNQCTKIKLSEMFKRPKFQEIIYRRVQYKIIEARSFLYRINSGWDIAWETYQLDRIGVIFFLGIYLKPWWCSKTLIFTDVPSVLFFFCRYKFYFSYVSSQFVRNLSDVRLIV